MKIIANVKVKILLLLIFSIFITSCMGEEDTPATPPGPTGAGVIRHTIISPLNEIVKNQQSTYYAGTTSVGQTRLQTQTLTRYKDFEYDIGASSIAPSPEPYCKVGGMYRIQVFNDPLSVKSYNKTEDLFYCSTTKDLIRMIKIPNQWRNANLLFYCNDGANINIEGVNFNPILANVNAYKLCVLKNLDLDKDNTIIYGLEVGNTEVDSDSAYRFDGNSKTGLIVKDLEYISNIPNSENRTYTFHYKDNKNKSYYFTYNARTTFFNLKDRDLDLTKNISSIFPNMNKLNKFGKSRVALFKRTDYNKDNNFEITYGYELANSLVYNDSGTTRPLYIIETNIDLKDCDEMLGEYETLVSSSPVKDSKVSCSNKDDKIYINSARLDAIQGEKTSFNLFKNIIINLLN